MLFLFFNFIQLCILFALVLQRNQLQGMRLRLQPSHSLLRTQALHPALQESPEDLRSHLHRLRSLESAPLELRAAGPQSHLFPRWKKRGQCRPRVSPEGSWQGSVLPRGQLPRSDSAVCGVSPVASEWGPAGSPASTGCVSCGPEGLCGRDGSKTPGRT